MTEGSFDPAWRDAIFGADVDVLRGRLADMITWAKARIEYTDRELADRDLSTLTPTDLVHLTERTALVAVLTQLAGIEDGEGRPKT
jgi:hypothetical protein